ncbi:MAG: hypothetical protein IKN55_10905 [Oscillospiraceae bacterium]|nr:hypothetical protein [Oscillospiraceae bacterium]
MNEKLKAVMADEAFVKSCIEAENEAAVQQLFADQGIEMSLTEIELMKEMIGAVADGRITGEQLEKLSQAGELSEEELAEAAGGIETHWIEGEHSPIIDTLFGKKYGVFGDAYLYELSGAKIGMAAAGVAAVGAAAYGIYKFKDEIAAGATAAYGWVKDNITRW